MGLFGRRRASEEPTLEQLRNWHLLLLPEQVRAEQVDALVRCRYPDSQLADTRRARLGRRAALTGPHLLEPDELDHVKVPAPWRNAYALEVASERDSSAFDDIADPVLRAWWMRAFPTGKPYRDEGDAVDLALELARRLGGVVRASGSNVVLQPDYDRLLDLTVWTGYWLDPDRLLELLTPVLPGVQVDLSADGHHVAPQHTDGVQPNWSLDPLDPRWVDFHHAVDSLDQDLIERVGRHADETAVQSGVVLDGYAAASDGGLVTEVIQEDNVPQWVRDRVAHQLLAVANPVVTYTVRWMPHDPVALESEDPLYAVRLERDRVRPRMRAAALALAEATAGVITDSAGFEVDRYSL